MTFIPFRRLISGSLAFALARAYGPRGFAPATLRVPPYWPLANGPDLT
jgi:hypothetical protein